LILLALIAGDYYINNNQPINNVKPGYGTANTSLTDGSNGNPNTNYVAAPGKQTNAPRNEHANGTYVNRRTPSPVAVTNNVAWTKQPANENYSVKRPLASNAAITTDMDVVTPKAFYANFNNYIGFRNKPGYITFGVEAGVNSDGFYQNQTSNNMMKTGFHAGGIFNICLSNHFALQPALLYERMGSQSINPTQTDGNMDITTTNKYTLSYIKIPANLVYKFGRYGSTRFMIGAGPYVSYLAGSKNTQSNATAYNNTGIDSRTSVLSAGQINNISNSNNNANLAYNGSMGNAYPALPDAPGAPQTGLTNNFRKLDYGAGCFIGCELPRGFFAKLGGNVGFRNVQQNATGTYANRNYDFEVSIGQFINW
jgi:hypothetical protein